MAKNKGLLFKVIRAYAYTPHDQDDLFQEITIQLWKSVPNFRGESKESTWIYRVALFSAIAWTRKEKKHKSAKEPITDLELIHAEKSEPNDPQLDWLYEQIAKLNEIDRSLTLLLLDGYSYKEMAEIIGISESNVGVKINRIKKSLTQKSQETNNGV